MVFLETRLWGVWAWVCFGGFGGFWGVWALGLGLGWFGAFGWVCVCDFWCCFSGWLYIPGLLRFVWGWYNTYFRRLGCVFGGFWALLDGVILVGFGMVFPGGRGFGLG